MMFGGYDVGFGMMIWWGLLIAAGVMFLLWVSRSIPDGSKSDAPLEIVKRRYVRGEISKDEYNKLRRDLV